MTSLEWCHIQVQDPILSQILREIHGKTLGKMKIKMGMPSELKALIRNRTQLTLKHGVMYKNKRVNARTKQLLVVPQSYRQRAMEGCHDQVGHRVRTGCWTYCEIGFTGQACMLMLSHTSTVVPGV